MKISDEYAIRNSVGTWFNGFINVAILFLTIELVVINRQNLVNSTRNANNSSRSNELLEDIKEKI